MGEFDLIRSVSAPATLKRSVIDHAIDEIVLIPYNLGVIPREV